MQRWIVRIVICLALGVISTSAVAWVCSWLDDVSYYETERIVDSAFIDPIIRAHGVDPAAVRGWYDTDGYEIIRFGARRNAVASQITPTFGDIRTAIRIDVTERFAGWPMYALHGSRVIINGTQVNEYLEDGWNPTGDPIELEMAQFLPLRPMFPGFLIDALFYAAAWLGVFVGLGFTRRAIRKRCGRCPACGYDLRGDHKTGCPECGWNRGSMQ